jgi:hypothetical protein
MTTENGTIGRYLGWFLAALSAGAGAIHFAVAGGHFDVGWWHGFFFAVVAWLQLSWAAAIVVRPTRPLLAAGVIINTGVIITWAMSRTVGVPIGPDAWTSEPVSLADGLATGFEAGLVLLSLVVLFRPAFAQRSLAPRLGFAGLGTTGLVIAVVSTVALTPSFASDHHGGHGAEGDGHSHGATETAAAHSHAGGEAEGDASDPAGHAHTNVVITADDPNPCNDSGFAGANGESAHGHKGPIHFEALSAADRATFIEQQRAADAVIAAHPTVADAEADGYRLITQYVPCIGAHYIKYGALGNDFDPAEPEVILYDGQDPDSKVVGLSYLQFGDPDVQPEGFVGPNDTWHIHSILCANPSVGIVGDGLTDEECEARGGHNLDTARLWMMHMWNAPGYTSEWGLFSSENPLLGGTFRSIDG